MRVIRSPLTLPRNPELLKKVLDMKIAITLHHFDLSDTEDPEAVYKARNAHAKPTWENVVALLKECYDEINKDRESPIKY